MVDKMDYKIVGLAILFLICWMGYFPLAARGAVVWSDDFNDGDYDGWTICENLVLGSEWPTAGFNGSQWLATNSYLQLDQEGKGVITYPSNVAYGTWSFDFKFNETQIGFLSWAEVVIISSGHILTTDDWVPLEGFAIWIRFDVFTIEEPHDFTLSLKKGHDGDTTTIDSAWHVPVAGWHHIDVTRNTTGWFSVYHNGSPIMEGGDTDIDTSELFMVWFEEWQMIDNIVVDDELLTIDSASIDWVLIAIIGASAVVIIAVLVIILKRR
ncbi:MAG: hypothetical protein ACW96M_05560 [Candidatus Thorarchaeota archaeon]